MAVVVPREHRIVISKTSVSITTGRVSLPRLFGTSELGDGFGVAAGKFSPPISMDVASDNRMYVLDAGNSRIQVFDGDGIYITQWGTPGSDSGLRSVSTSKRTSTPSTLRTCWWRTGMSL